MIRILSRAAICLAMLVSAPAAEPAAAATSAAAVAALEQALAKDNVDLAELARKDFATVGLTKADAAKARDLLAKSHLTRLAKERAAEFASGKLVDDKLEMPFFIKKFGDKPKNGHSLWFSLHGGGGAPAPLNDSQWENQKRLYKLEEGIYLVPRAPTNTWNLWHEGHIDRMFDRLIADAIAVEGIDSNRVYVLGYSAGGDGVYQLAPRMADRWAAAAMMAGHPNDAQPLSLRNVPFSIQVGGRDAAFNRNKVAAEWGEKLAALQKADPEGYPHQVKIHAGKGHWMNGEDAAILPWMAKQAANPTPNVVVWKQSGRTHDRSYWLAVPPGEAKAGALVIAERQGQTITIKQSEGIDRLLIRLDDRMLDLDQPVKVVRGDKTLFEGKEPRTIAMQIETLRERNDPQLIFSSEVVVKLGP